MARQLFVAVVALVAGGACSSSQPELTPMTARDSLRTASERCEVPPPFTPHFEPELHWEWTGSPVLPEHKQVMMTPVVVDVNADGTPDIVFSTFAGGNYSTDGVLRAISGDDGHALWTVTAPAHRVKAAASIAAGDLDSDGQVEVCAIPENGRGVICFEHDGTFKFRTPEDANDYNEWGGPSLADLEGDGTVEILDGNRVYSHTGALKWVGSDGMGGARSTGPVSFAVDLDQDGQQEVVNGRSVYRHDGTVLCANPDVPHGFASVANFDEDPKGEIVVSGRDRVSLVDDDCSVVWSIPVPQGGHGGPPNIDDFDGDGALEIGLPGENAYNVLEADGSLKWSSPIHDYSSGRTGSTTFDFEQDGSLEVVFADETKLRIYDGATGAVRFETSHSSGTTHENPVIADVDGDNAADIIVAANNHAYPGHNGIRVFHDRLEGWANTRRIWNQHAYSVTNVEDDGSIPAHPKANWSIPQLNTFRANTAGYLTTGPNPYAAADLLVTEVTAVCDGEGGFVLGARIANQGDAAVAAGLKVAFYEGNASSSGMLLGVATLTEALAPGGHAFVSLPVSNAFSGSTEVFVTVDDDGTGAGRDTECREDNNTASVTVELDCSVPPSNQPPVALCHDVTVSADASCRASASVDHGSYDPDQAPGPLSLEQSPAGPYGLGSHSVTLTASDGAASDQCVGTVTVVDTSKPTITCPLSVDAKVRLGHVGVIVDFSVTASDNCGPAPVVCSHPSGFLFLPGLTTVTCTATDGSGNSASCNFGVRVRANVSL